MAFDVTVTMSFPSQEIFQDGLDKICARFNYDPARHGTKAQFMKRLFIREFWIKNWQMAAGDEASAARRREIDGIQIT